MRFMPVREFLRGGYQTIDEPTVVSSRGYVLFTVWPGPPRIKTRGQLSTAANPQGGGQKLQVVLQGREGDADPEAQ